jgi:uncharacterized RDD family membrane protein YckC
VAIGRTIHTGAPAAWHGGVAVAGLAAPRAMTPPVRPVATDLSPEAAVGELVYAGFWIRVLAALIDGVIVSIGVAILTRGNAPLNGMAMIAYQGLMVGLWNGQTLGKRACGLRVIREDGYMCGVAQAFGRALAKIVCAITLTIGYLMVAFTERKRGLHDILASTVVVHTVDGNI